MRIASYPGQKTSAAQQENLFNFCLPNTLFLNKAFAPALAFEELLEQASAKVLSYTDTPSYKLVKTVFKKMKNRDVDTVREADPSIEHAFIRNLRGDVK